MTDFDLEVDMTPEDVMTAEEADLAEQAYAAIMDASRYSERSLQAAEYRAGVSDLGFCSERLRRMLAQEVPEDSDLLPAFIGTAIGDHAEQAFARKWPDAIRQSEVTVQLPGQVRTYNMVGHPDLILPGRGYLFDVKTARGLALAERSGPSQSQQFQRHCYAKGAHAAGLFGDIPLADVKVGNLWIDRAADDRWVYVQLEPYDEGIVTAAAEWLDEVVYAYLNDETARKEPPREMCAKTCGFFATCRMYDTDVEGLITDDEALTGVQMYREGLDLERAGKRLKDQAKAALHGVQGSTGEFAVRWVHVNGSHVEFDRKPSERLDIKPIK